MFVDRLGFILRVHRRARWLPAIFEQIYALSRGRRTFVSVVADRPSPDVLAAVERMREAYSLRLEVKVLEAPRPLLSTAGQAWMQSFQAGLDAIPRVFSVCGTWDDDCVLSVPALKEAAGILADFQHDRYDVLWLHTWDAETQVNLSFPPHIAALFWRRLPGDRFDPALIAHAPRRASLSQDAARLSAPLLHHGYLSEADRSQAWLASKRAGRIDAHTSRLVEPPVLGAFTSDFELPILVRRQLAPTA